MAIFSDLKKHLFSYQFYSTATPVKNYAVKSWAIFADTYDQVAKQNLDKSIKIISKEKIFPHLSILTKDFEVASIK